MNNGEFQVLIHIGIIVLTITAGVFAFILAKKTALKGRRTNEMQKTRHYLYQKKVLVKGPKVVAIGGGTGLSTLLRGLKLFTCNITAVVTVADDGGSSGTLREDMGILPPGDIRNCILALSNVEPTMEQLFQYRFKEGVLKGQNLGNLLIAAMSDIANGFEAALERITEVLALTGRVYPVTLEDLRLIAKLEDGTIVHGESQIPIIQMKKNSPIKEIAIDPSDCKAHPGVLRAIEEADAIVLGPGSLYTSVIPNILVGDVAKAIHQSKAVKIYVSNIMTQPGETTGYTVADHVKALFKHGGDGLFEFVLVNCQGLPNEVIGKYREEMSYPVYCDRSELESMGLKVVEAQVADYSKGLIRHNARELARKIINLILEYRFANDKLKLLDYYYLKDIVTARDINNKKNKAL